MASQQYREYAKECLQWAEESTSDEDRHHFVEMAKAWMHAAAELEKSSNPRRVDGTGCSDPEN